MKKKPKLILTIGLQASGKSTWARDYVDKSNGGAINLCKDELRLMFDDTKVREKKVIALRDMLTERYLAEGIDVVWSDTNLNPIHQTRGQELALAHGAEYVEQSFLDVPIEVCIKRDLQRFTSVGEAVIRRTYNQWLVPKPQPIRWDIGKRNCFVFDIDGTLSIMGDRSPYDWSRVSLDAPNESIVQISRALGMTTDIIMVSGRDEVCREDTLHWLDIHNIPCTALYMRPANDNRKDYVVKREIYERDILPTYNVIAVFDDRKQVVDEIRSMGITVCQVAPGDF